MFLTHTALELHVNTRLAELRGMRGGLKAQPYADRETTPTQTRDRPLSLKPTTT
jgi:hypothetical protein